MCIKVHLQYISVMLTVHFTMDEGSVYSSNLGIPMSNLIHLWYKSKPFLYFGVMMCTGVFSYFIVKYKKLIFWDFGERDRLVKLFFHNSAL